MYDEYMDACIFIPAIIRSLVATKSLHLQEFHIHSIDVSPLVDSSGDVM